MRRIHSKKPSSRTCWQTHRTSCYPSERIVSCCAQPRKYEVQKAEDHMADTLGLMGIFAHPDDETFGMAGSFARAIQSGHRAALVCATRGEVGEIAHPSLATPENLGQVREGELRKAMAAVGVSDVSFLV